MSAIFFLLFFSSRRRLNKVNLKRTIISEVKHTKGITAYKFSYSLFLRPLSVLKSVVKNEPFFDSVSDNDDLHEILISVRKHQSNSLSR